MKNNGFSILEAVLTMAVMAILGLGLIRTNELNFESSRILEGFAGRDSLNKTIQLTLKYKDTCNLAFRVGTPAAHKVNLLNAASPTGDNVELDIPNLNAGDNQNSNTLTANNLLNNNQITKLRIRVEKLNLHGLSPALALPLLGPNIEVRRVQLRTAASMTMINSETGLHTRLQNIGSVFLKLDSSASATDPTVVDCYSAVNQTLKEICLNLGGDYDETRNPPCRFPATPFECGPGMMWTGISGGLPQCSLVRMTCPAPSLLEGVGLGAKPADCHDPEYSP